MSFDNKEFEIWYAQINVFIVGNVSQLSNVAYEDESRLVLCLELNSRLIIS